MQPCLWEWITKSAITASRVYTGSTSGEWNRFTLRSERRSAHIGKLWSRCRMTHREAVKSRLRLPVSTECGTYQTRNHNLSTFLTSSLSTFIPGKMAREMKENSTSKVIVKAIAYGQLVTDPHTLANTKMANEMERGPTHAQMDPSMKVIGKTEWWKATVRTQVKERSSTKASSVETCAMGTVFGSGKTGISTMEIGRKVRSMAMASWSQTTKLSQKVSGSMTCSRVKSEWLWKDETVKQI